MLWRNVFVFSLLLWISYATAQSQNDVLQVTKEIVSGSQGLYTVRVGYKSVGESGRAFNINIWDSLPSTLDLVSGKLVLKGEQPTSEWTYNTYQVRVNPRGGIQFTLDKRDEEVALPAAEITFTRADKSASVEVLRTDPVSLTVSLVIPEGHISLSPLIAFFTLALPVLAAVYAIPHFRAVALRNKKKSWGNKKN